MLYGLFQVGLVGLCSLVSAETTGADLSVDLSREVLSGQAIAVEISIANKTNGPLVLPDLNARPWLVRFDLVGRGGGAQSRYLTPPENDPGGEWTIAPRGRREVVMELPSGKALRPGDYQLTVRVVGGEQEFVEGPLSFRIAEARPVAGDLGWEVHGGGRQGTQSLWVHKASTGFDVYMHQADAGKPSRTLGNHHLVHLADPVEPFLTHSRPQERWDRTVYWQVDARTIAYARLRGTGLRGEVERFQSPHPKIELLGRGATDSEGGLHIPVWIPAPSGDAGELRVVSLRTRREIRFRSVVRLEARPDWIETALDAAGNLRILVAHNPNVDLYLVPPDLQAPAVGTRLETRKSGRPVAGRFGVLPPSGDHPGGRSVLVVSRTETGFVPTWYGFDRVAVQTQPTVVAAQGVEILDVLPDGYESAVLLLSDADKAWVARGSRASKPVGATHQTWLASDKDRNTWLRTLAKKGPVRVVPVSLED